MADKRTNNPNPDNAGRRDEVERLRAMLLEDTGSVEDADALLETVQLLKRWHAPQPDNRATEQLLETLLPEMSTESRLQRAYWSFGDWWPWLLLRAQLRVVRREIWSASALVFVLGTVVTAMYYQSNPSADMLPIVLFAPLVAAIGIAFLYGPDVERIAELEQTTPTPPRLLLLVRLALVFGFNLFLGIGASVALTLTQSNVSLWPLVVSWLAPMTFLSTFAFLLSVMFSDPLAGVLVAMLLWGFQSLHWFAQYTGDSFGGFDSYIPNLLTAEARPWLLLLAALLGIVALWLVGREERRIVSYH